MSRARVDLGEAITYFNNAAADLPDHTRLKGRKLPSMSVVLDGKGGNFADVFEPGNRRVWVALADIPDFVQKAFIAAEDRRFFQHHGVDERGIIRAFIGNLAEPGRPQGGSTITQQVVKNLLVGEDVTYERKIREMIVASRLESTLSKPEILELYLNSAYLGRGSWGVEMAARSYFGKSAKTLTLGEGAMLAGLLKGPSFFNPDRHPDRAKERLTYVLGRMQEDGVITAEQKEAALAAPPKLVAFERPHRDSGFQFVDYLGREAKSDGVESLTAEPYTVHSTINAALQRHAETALQEGLAHYEIASGRMQFRGPEANIADAVQKLAADKKPRRSRRAGAAGLATGAASCPPAALRRALGAGRRGAEGRQERRRCDPRRSRRWTHHAADGMERADQARSQSLRRGLCPGDRWQRAEGAAKAGARRPAQPRRAAAPRRNCACGRPCKGRRWCSRTRPAASSPWPGAFPIR